ncbi:MAG: amidohydrolase family protein [Myxococcaceae bacterium]
MLVLLLAAAARAEAPRPVVLRAARLFDGTSEVLVQGGVAILVENGVITAVGKSVAVPPGAEVIELGDVTLLPGFIDAHTHLSFESSDNWYRDQVEALQRHPAEQAHFAATYARRTLEAGFTTVRDLGSSDFIDVSLRNAIARGLVPGPRMLVAVHGIGATGGHADADPYPTDRVIPPGIPEGICNGADACRAAVRYQAKGGADVIKVMASGGVLSLADSVDAPQLTLEELTAVVEEAHRLGKKVAAHCHGDVAGKAAIAAGVDSLEHGSFLKPDTLAQMKAKGVYLVPTLLAGEWTGGKIDTFPPAIAEKARAALKARSQMFRDALQAGVRIGFGTDSAVSPHGLNAREFALMVGLGMTPAAALRAATSVDAALLGVSGKLGTLEVGKVADVVAVPGNPLTDIRVTERVLFVMKDGAVVKRPPY